MSRSFNGYIFCETSHFNTWITENCSEKINLTAGVISSAAHIEVENQAIQMSDNFE